MSDLKPALPASTLILLRACGQHFEVLLLKRANTLQFAGGSWVFPGGRVEADDAADGDLHSLSANRIAAARECEEEAGLQLKPDNFIPYSHWTTPRQKGKRFATSFLLGVLDEFQAVRVDDSEIVEFQWLTPAQGLEQHRRGKLPILPPAFITLLELSRVNTIEDAITFAQSRQPPRFFPRLVHLDEGFVSLYEDDIAYESGNLDLEGRRHRVILGGKGWEYLYLP